MWVFCFVLAVLCSRRVVLCRNTWRARATIMSTCTSALAPARCGCSDERLLFSCIYFLDPDQIVPPSATTPAVPPPLVPRTRNNSFSQPDLDPPLILEPPVTTNPILCRPTLPLAEIASIRRLSARVNVLPVIAHADTLTNDRLTAVKLAVRRDLADAGIGFGIFDVDYTKDALDPNPLLNGGEPKFPGNFVNGSSASSSSSPTSPVSPSFLRLPYALISPDNYSHSDGVGRLPASRHEIIMQYTPSSHLSYHHHPSPPKIIRGKFTRHYRWGFLDVSFRPFFLPSSLPLLPLSRSLRLGPRSDAL